MLLCCIILPIILEWQAFFFPVYTCHSLALFLTISMFMLLISQPTIWKCYPYCCLNQLLAHVTKTCWYWLSIFLFGSSIFLLVVLQFYTASCHCIVFLYFFACFSDSPPKQENSVKYSLVSRKCGFIRSMLYMVIVGFIF